MTLPWRPDTPRGPGVDDLLAALTDLARAARAGIIPPQELEGPICRIVASLFEEGTPPGVAETLTKQSLARGGLLPAPDGEDVHRVVEGCIAECFRPGLTPGSEG